MSTKSTILIESVWLTYISYAHGEFSSCIQGTFFFTTFHTNQVYFSSMAASCYKFRVWRKCHCPCVHCEGKNNNKSYPLVCNRLQKGKNSLLSHDWLKWISFTSLWKWFFIKNLCYSHNQSNVNYQPNCAFVQYACFLFNLSKVPCNVLFHSYGPLLVYDHLCCGFG